MLTQHVYPLYMASQSIISLSLMHMGCVAARPYKQIIRTPVLRTSLPESGLPTSATMVTMDATHATGQCVAPKQNIAKICTIL